MSEEQRILDLKPGNGLDKEVAILMGKPWKKPTHGTCCICQRCGYSYDDCQCYYSTGFYDAWNVAQKLMEDG
jgi:hypothetical protein